MNLIIDIGNTAVKIAVFNDGVIVNKEVVVHEDLIGALVRVKSTYTLVEKAILSSVSTVSERVKIFFEKNFTTLVLDHTIKMPFKNLYATPTTLGVDRLALVAAAVSKFPKEDALIIDVGTCITYDFKNDKEEYLGGAISPGLRLRYESLHKHTANLPLLGLKEPKHLIGDTTVEAIHSGVVNGIVCEIDGVISQYCNTYPELTVILTGGDAHFLSNRLKNSIFATSNFLLEGLNHILAYNNSQ